jgi:hypothetical protein
VNKDIAVKKRKSFGVEEEERKPSMSAFVFLLVCSFIYSTFCTCVETPRGPTVPDFKSDAPLTKVCIDLKSSISSIRSHALVRAEQCCTEEGGITAWMTVHYSLVA